MIGDIEKALTQLVEHRHVIIQALAKGPQDGQDRSWPDQQIEPLLKIQSAIDVLERLWQRHADNVSKLHLEETKEVAGGIRSPS
jgi:hypothetical protein